MALDYKELRKFEKDIDRWFESAEGKAYFEKEKKKNDIKKGRQLRFEKWLEHNDFDKLMYRLILEHGEEWREKCWSKGYEVFMNNKLDFVFHYVTANLEPISVPQIESEHFHCQVWFFKGYYFRIMHGQGSVVDIYNGGDFKHLLSA